MKKSAIYGLAAAICVLASGCGKSVNQSTPQSVAESFKNAAKNDDWTTAFSCLTDESQDMMLMPVAIVGAFAMMDKEQDKAKEIKAIFEKHGVDMKAKKDGFKNVKNKGALFGDFIAWSQKHADDKDKSDDIKSKISAEKFENFKVDGNKATCDSSKHKMHFTNVDGKWYIDLVASMKAKRSKAMEKISGKHAAR